MRRRRRPHIGVTGPDRGGEAAWLFTWFAVWMQGGKAIRITPARPCQTEDPDLDGLILGGGADINPERYGAELLVSESRDKPKPTGFRQWLHWVLSIVIFPLLFVFRNLFSTKPSKSLDTARSRDDLEFTLLQWALKKEVPVLGICRGAQLINVQFGGSLHQDIGSFYSEVPQVYTVWPEKKVEIEPDSKLYQIIRAPKVWVNALHNQAVDNVGSQLKIVACEENGVVQAIEHSDYPFLIGVQWHPEYMPQIPFQRDLFRGLVQTARSGDEQPKEQDERSGNRSEMPLFVSES